MHFRFFRLLPIFLTIVVLTWFVPKTYLRITKGERWSVTGQYSCITNDFVIWDSRPSGFVFRDRNGKEYPPVVARRLMPFVFYSDVLRHNGFPLKVHGRSFSYQDAVKNHVFRISPSLLFAQHRPLHFLLESAPATVGFVLPESIMVLDNDKVRFIACKSGELRQEKSVAFTKEMQRAGVVFPILVSATNNNTRKKFDEGMLFVDSEGKLFQLKQIKEKPVCRFLNHKFAKPPLFISVDENIKKDYYGQIVTEDGVYLVSYDEKLIRLPLPSYDPSKTLLKVWNKPLYQTLVVKDVDIRKPTELIVVDEAWQVTTTHSEPCPEPVISRSKWVGYGLSLLAPFRLKTHLPYQTATILSVDPAPSLFLAIVACLFFAALYLFVTRHFYPGYSLTRRIRHQALEVAIIVFFGLPGMIATLIFGPLAAKATAAPQTS